MIRILQGDCREVLKTLPAESVHCVVSSPPYWGLRDYGTAQWEGGDAGCDHIGKRSVGASTLNGGAGILENHKVPGIPYRNICLDCGARRIDSQIGLEPDYRDYLATMVAVFREIKRVLRKDGTAWVNMGDSYSGYHGNKNSEVPTSATNGWTNGTNENLRGSAIKSGLKPKDLCGIPWRLAFALQDDGWYLRSDIIWSKPNPMPESITDRPTKAHEYLFLLAKSQRYYYDTEAIREPGSQNKASDEHVKRMPLNGREYNPAGRNRRTVWEIPTAPFSEAHFATFPPALVEPCILAGCPKGGTVLDPFGGAGTTGLVADRLGRNAILIELNPDYAAMAEKRMSNDAGLFAAVTAELWQEMWQKPFDFAQEPTA